MTKIFFKIYVIFLFVLIQNFAFGQSKTGYPFIVDSMNVIKIPNGKSERLSSFYIGGIFTVVLASGLFLPEHAVMELIMSGVRMPTQSGCLI